MNWLTEIEKRCEAAINSTNPPSKYDETLICDDIPKLIEAVKILREALEFYANHESVIKAAYHSNDERQITCVHTSINRKAREALQKVEGMK